MALQRKARPAPSSDEGSGDGFNHAEERALEALRKVARQWPHTLMLYANANAHELVALRVDDLDAYLAAGGELPPELPSETFRTIGSDGGRPG
ncbi:hypothetical protein [Nakamurella deserti]|uniref:hypothetical protein n=1 Tax=Nakamurella deserti TaxID=2164074 RepID=UPI000DBE736C|nr:hypothetical protein [Nakamurella deserti]